MRDCWLRPAALMTVAARRCESARPSGPAAARCCASGPAWLARPAVREGGGHPSIAPHAPAKTRLRADPWWGGGLAWSCWAASGCAHIRGGGSSQPWPSPSCCTHGGEEGHGPARKNARALFCSADPGRWGGGAWSWWAAAAAAIHGCRCVLLPDALPAHCT